MLKMLDQESFKESALDLVTILMVAIAALSILYTLWVVFFGVHMIDHEGLCMAEIMWRFVQQSWS